MNGDRLDNHFTNLAWGTSSNDGSVARNPVGNDLFENYFDLNDLEGEKWRECPFDRGYFVSNLGRVKSTRTKGGRILKPDISLKYARVTIAGKKFYIHRLVYSVFNDDWDIPEGFVIGHIDTNKRNNRLENLQKLSETENNQKRFDDIRKKEQGLI